MKIELVIIGDEVLAGSTIDTNSAYIAQILKKEGYGICRYTTLPDQKEVMQEELERALSRADLVITTGGLGPTFDDLTKKVLVSIFQSDVFFDEGIARDLTNRFPHISTIENQATIPRKAKIIPNKIGTAPGLIFQDRSVLIALPGVPQEMQPMLQEVMPFIRSRFVLSKKYYEKTFSLCLVHEWQVEPYIVQWQKMIPGLQWGIYPFLGGVHIRIKICHQNPEEVEHLFLAVEEKILAVFSQELYSKENLSLPQVVHAALQDKKKTLALAESCTGGAIASSMTKVSGTSASFLGSLVVYSNEFKEQFLQVSHSTLQQKGAVSQQTVEEMADHLFSLSHADYVASVSGIAGPGGGTKNKPVGTVWVAIAHRGEKPDTVELHVPGDRSTVIHYTTQVVFGLLLRKIRDNLPHDEARIFTYR
ncbi:MAG: CinA family nicotinamide mononucleotide deamidase-related protein [Parachlamydiales bacterium]|nr:CinA family nicotinamide mononucleotide deamidase-related protein [Parachlamydiales bacterium]